MGRKAVVIDRDGTINVDYGYVYKIESFKLLPGTMEALKLLNQHGVAIFVVTNQSGIARGHYTEDDFHRLTKHMRQIFELEGIHLDDVIYCPHHPNAAVENYRAVCDCRKPSNGILKKLINRYDLCVDDMALIGDRNRDIEAGRSLGIFTYLVETGQGYLEKEKTRACQIVPGLKDAVVHLLNRWGMSVQNH